MRTCDVIENGEQCEGKHNSRGMCAMHYWRWKRHGDPLITVRLVTETCTVIENGDKCERKHYAKGMCQKHYERFKVHGDPLTVNCVYEQRENEKWCPSCKEWLPKDSFAKGESEIFQSRCRGCARNLYLRSTYQIDQQQFDQMLADQGGTCAICETAEPGGKGSWHVDHDHKCCPGNKSCGACVRELLCYDCNTGLGKFDDDPDLLLAAAMYILKHKTNTEVTQ